MVISKRDGVILLILFALYFLYPIIIEIKNIVKTYKQNKNNKTDDIKIDIKKVIEYEREQE